MKQIYPKSLEEYMKSKPESVYIPRRLYNDEKLRLYKRYYQVFQELYFKVIDVYNTDGIEYYTIRYNDSMIGTMTFPIDYSTTYEMIPDRMDIANLDNIINTDISYTGAEIKFWFYSHNIDFDDEYYEKFYPYISNTSKSEISDEKSYFVYTSTNESRKCRFVLDKFKLKRRKRYD